MDRTKEFYHHLVESIFEKFDNFRSYDSTGEVNGYDNDMFNKDGSVTLKINPIFMSCVLNPYIFIYEIDMRDLEEEGVIDDVKIKLSASMMTYLITYTDKLTYHDLEKRLKVLLFV